jgi:transcription antitermination factor NusG
MGVKTDSVETQSNSETCNSVLRPCAGGMPESPKESLVDPSAWYIAMVKRHNELVCRKILSDADRFPYKVEAYVAAQQELAIRANRTRHIKERVVIPGKIFIRVDPSNRQDVLKQCLLLSRYVMDPSASPTANGHTAFARVPDWEVQRLRDIFTLADGPVEYTDTLPRPHEKIQVLTGPLHGLRGTVQDVSGRKYATVLLDSLGVFSFKLPISDLAKLPE